MLRAHADPVEGALRVALDRLGRVDAEDVQDRGHDVDRVVVLAADLAPGLRAGRPRDDARVAGAAVELVPLPHLERGVERHRPAVGVVVVGPGAAEVVQLGEVLGHVVGDAVGELHLVDGAVRAALAAGAVVGDQDDDRVVALLGLLQVVEQPPDVVVGVRQEAGVDLRHPREQALLVVAERVPGPGVVELGERLAVGAGPGRQGVPIGLSGGSPVLGGTIPRSFCRARVCSRIAS